MWKGHFRHFTIVSNVSELVKHHFELVLLNISLFTQPLWGFPKRFLLFGHTLASKRGFKPNTEAQVLAPP